MMLGRGARGQFSLAGSPCLCRCLCLDRTAGSRIAQRPAAAIKLSAGQQTSGLGRDESRRASCARWACRRVDVITTSTLELSKVRMRMVVVGLLSTSVERKRAS